MIPGSRSRGQVVQRWLFGGLLVAVVVLGAVATWSFVWPSDAARGSYALGPVSGIERGSVTAYVINEEGELAAVADVAVRFGVSGERGGSARGSALVYVVRFPDGDLRVFSGASTHLGRVVVWRSDASTHLSDEYVGFFVEPSHSEQRAIDGTRISGPPPRDLDEYQWHLDDGVLVIELGELERGALGSPVPPPYDVTSEGWATSGWPSE
jgi:Rieske Fe-S protein